MPDFRQLLRLSLGFFFCCAVQGQAPTHVPRIALNSPYLGNQRDVVLPDGGKPCLVFPVSTNSGLARLDLIRAARLIPNKFGDELPLFIVLVDIKELDALAVVDTAIEQQRLLTMGLRQAAPITQLADKSGQGLNSSVDPNSHTPCLSIATDAFLLVISCMGPRIGS